MKGYVNLIDHSNHTAPPWCFHETLPRQREVISFILVILFKLMTGEILIF